MPALVAGANVESLEDRSLPTVSVLLIGGTLDISIFGADSVFVRSDASGNVEVSDQNGVLDTVQSLSAASVSSLVVTGSDSPNVIDLGEVSSTEFSRLTSIVVNSGDADDLVIGSINLNDSLDGGNGADTLIGQGGVDLLTGGDGDDWVMGGDGGDSLVGGNGADMLCGEDGNDTLIGGAGADLLEGEGGDDSVDGGNGADTLEGGIGNDTMNAGSGADDIEAGAGNDLVLGGADNDLIEGEDGLDTLDGQGGNDTLDGGAGLDILSGDDGADSLNGGDDADFLNGGADDDFANGGAANDTIYGGTGDDRLDGADGDDLIFGQSGNDSLKGGIGSDTIDGGAGNDVIRGDLPALSVADISVAEGDSGTVTVTLTEAFDVPVRFDYQTVTGSALAGDFVLTTGNALIPAGTLFVTIPVTTTEDTALEIDEQFTFMVLNPVDAILGDSQALVTILDDDFTAPRVNLTPTDITVLENQDGAMTAITMTVTLIDQSATPVTISTSTANGTAVGGQDYDILNTSLTFPVNPITGFAQGSQTITVIIRDDNFVGGDEDFFVNIGNLSGNMNIVNSQTHVTIINDEIGPASLTVDPVNVQELNLGQMSIATFVVRLSIPFDRDLPVTYFTSNGTATAPADYLATSGVIVIPSGVSSVNIPVTIVGDNIGENAETFFMNISAAAGTVTIVNTSATGTIALSDGGASSGGGGGGGGGRRIIIIIRWATDGTMTAYESDEDLEPIKTVTSEFQFDWQYADSVSDRVRDELRLAGDYWRQFIVDDVPDAMLPDGTLIDDLRVNVNVLPLDGPHGELAGAFVTARRDDSSLPLEATIQIDSADVDRLAQEGTLQTVLRHEIAHALGFGTTWDELGLTSPLGYRGSAGLAAYQRLHGVTATDVPLSPDGGHWNEDILGNELLTPVIDGPNLPVSSLTIAQFSDIGYGVDYSRAEDARLRASSSSRSPSRTSNLTGRLAAVAGSNQDVITGGDGNDTLIGGLENDTISGNGGNDSIEGSVGDDCLLGGSGHDTLNGGDGNDTLDGQGGNDLIDGRAGDDVVIWGGTGDGNDTIVNSAGFDTVSVNGTGTNNTFVVGKTSSKQLSVTEGGSKLVIDPNLTSVVINGNGGDDVVTVGVLFSTLRTALTIRGGDGNDTLSAAGVSMGLGRLRLEGDAGNDSLTGSAGNDVVIGGDGEDSLLGGSGNDTLSGGAGNDRLTGDAGNDVINGGADSDVLRGSDGNDSLAGGDGNDSLLGGNGNDFAAGEAGNDTLNGEAGNDSLTGDIGADTITGGDGADTIDGGAQSDSLSGNLGNDLVRGGDGDDTLDGGDGDDTLIGNDGHDLLLGGLGNDAINGGDGNDTASGGAGKDLLLGGDGNDFLLGGADSDTLLGANGDDTLNGQGGTDLLAGNQGTDLLTDSTAVVNETLTLSTALLAALEV